MESSNTTGGGNQFDSGSLWNRWEPHIHAPGTVLNDQFSGTNVWESYISALETAAPSISALGITDYYNTSCYQRVIAEKLKGRLQGCGLIFPNIELRLAFGTVKGRWVNLHILVSPERPDHVDEADRFLGQLTFSAHGDRFACRKDDLIRLGRQSDSKLIEQNALIRGAEQFKVDFVQLQQLYRESKWAQENILIAVAGSEHDGTSGVRDPADATLRQEVEKFAHIVFASSPSQREFWLGRKSAAPEEIESKYGGLKPCLHGSDAHEMRTVGAPDNDRFCWIKGAVHFDSLRQACIDPEGRAYVGPEVPLSAAASQAISSIKINNATWAKTPALRLNPGLVAIIGARGSGKTALADMIALGCDAIVGGSSRTSFLERAKDLLHGTSISLTWQDGEVVDRSLTGEMRDLAAIYPRARYLSQQFVEDLCSAQGMADALLREIERVIFEAHPQGEREGAVDFSELLEVRSARFREARLREEGNLADLSERIGVENEKRSLVPVIEKQIAEKKKLVAGYFSDRSKLAPKGSETRVQRLQSLTAAAEIIRKYIRHFTAQEQALLALKDEVADVRSNQAPAMLRDSQERHKASGIKDPDWDNFLLDYKGDVDTSLNSALTKARQNIAGWKGKPPEIPNDANLALIPDNAELEKTPLLLLEAEIARLQKLVSLDRETSNKFTAVSKRITEENAALARLEAKLIDCKGADERVRSLVLDREKTFRRVFEAIISEQTVLTDLYQPLMARLQKADGTLKKLSFTVSRKSDVVRWANGGEELLDLRHKGPFKGRGTLEQIALEQLKQPWEKGDATTIVAAMADFCREYQAELLNCAPVPKADQTEYRAWLKRFAKWLFSTEHISINYSIDYDGIDICKLSPGTRGIVLLLLYLALDDGDDRPLIIDQPEENLDPKSVFEELVGLFIQAKSRRQVIIVTHNANLVVNTDADQIILANSGVHTAGQLPSIEYTSGGLETQATRQAVCDILEGGEKAFQERARRMRVLLRR